MALRILATFAALLAGCGAPTTYDERTYAMARARLDEWIARADEPLRSELSRHRDAFDGRMAALPSDPAARSSAIRDIYTEAMQTHATYQERILADLRAKVAPALAASGLVGYWSGDSYRLSITAAGRLSYAREGGSTLVSGEIIRVDPSGLRLQVHQRGSDDRWFELDHAPRAEGTLRVIRVNQRVLRFWQ